MPMDAYLTGMEAGLMDAKDGVDGLAESIHFVKTSRPDINLASFIQGYQTAQANHKATC